MKTYDSKIVVIFKERKSNRRKVDSEPEQSGSPVNGTVCEAHPGEVSLKSSVGGNESPALRVREVDEYFLHRQSVWYRDNSRL